MVKKLSPRDTQISPGNYVESKVKKYFKTNRRFDNLVPVSYKRTIAPRLSTLGSTFYEILKTL